MPLFKLMLLSKPAKRFISAFFYHDFMDVWRGAAPEDMPEIYTHELRVMLNNATMQNSYYHQEHMRDYCLAQRLSVMENDRRVQVELPISPYRIYFLDRVVFDAGDDKLSVSYAEFCRILAYYATLLDRKICLQTAWKEKFFADLADYKVSRQICPLQHWTKVVKKAARRYLHLFVKKYEDAVQLTLTSDDLTSFADLKCTNTLTYLSVELKPDGKIDDIEDLSRFEKLEYLQLTSLPLENLLFLQKMPKLRTLYLSDNGISDISPLAALEQLKQLHLYRNPVRDLSVLRRLPNLKFFFTDVELVPTQSIADSLSPQLTVTASEVLLIKGSSQPIFREKISSTPRSRAFVPRVDPPKDPRRLEIKDRWLYSGIYRALGFCPTVAYDMKKLKQLDCSDRCPLVEDYLFFTEKGDYSALLHAVNLKKLYLSDRILNDFSVLRNCTKLTHLDVSNTNFEDLSLLENFPELIELNLSGLHELRSAESLQSLKKLRNLYADTETTQRYAFDLRTQCIIL